MSATIGKVAVCGAGAMGSGIAQVAAQAGASVLIFDVNIQALETSRARTLADLDKLAARGKLSADEARAIGDRMQWVSTLDALADRELVIEAIIEDAGIKGQLFERIEAIIAPDAMDARRAGASMTIATARPKPPIRRYPTISLRIRIEMWGRRSRMPHLAPFCAVARCSSARPKGGPRGRKATAWARRSSCSTGPRPTPQDRSASPCPTRVSGPTRSACSRRNRALASKSPIDRA
jgi:NAD(P)-dependent dehydrogenase (short-subunit alcohol dehydrogenase family)